MTVKFITMGPGTLSIGETATLKDFSSQVTSCKLTPAVDNGEPINVLSGEQVAGDRSESFTLDGTFLQDLGVDSATEWLFANRGTTLPFTFVPSTSAGREVTGDLVVEAIDIGGDVKTKPTADFSFVVVGAPAIAAVAPAGASASSSKL